jgi:hypothetical protein
MGWMKCSSGWMDDGANLGEASFNIPMFFNIYDMILCHHLKLLCIHLMFFGNTCVCNKGKLKQCFNIVVKMGFVRLHHCFFHQCCFPLLEWSEKESKCINFHSYYLKVWCKQICNFGFLPTFDYHLFHDFHLCLGRMEPPTNSRFNVIHLEINVWLSFILVFFSLIKSTIYVNWLENMFKNTER